MGLLIQAGLKFSLGLIFSFILAGLDYRFGWSELPDWLVAAASVFALSLIIG